MNAAEAWVRSGLAADAARELGWFVLLVVIGIAITLWRDSK